MLSPEKEECRPPTTAQGRGKDNFYELALEEEKALLCGDCQIQLGSGHQRELRQKLNELAKQYPTLREGEYREKLLSLFRERGLDLNAEQLDMLLLLRQKTDQMLLERKAERQEDKP